MDSVREDIGYMDYKLNRRDTYAGWSDKIKIEYLNLIEDLSMKLERVK